ncbi:LysR family transcriptional regulator [Moorella naiadis]|uniref:LysR family transcriptional regulator n=1 Tax=Moorella naiadis (nom. illeg.) TaxID=3093670 RepID=UPI003D9C7FE3
MDLLHFLKTFVCLADNGTMSKAMDILQYSQPTISTHIAALEDFYKCPLLEFQNKRYVLTEEGRVLYNYATKMLTTATEAFDALLEFRNLERGSLAIGASENIGVYMIPQILTLFRQNYPQLKLQVVIDKTSEIEKKVINYELNIGLVEAELSSHNKLKIELLKKEPLILIAAPSHPWAKQGSIAINDLLKEPFVVGEPGAGTQKALERQLGDVINHVNVALDLGSTEAVKKAVANSFGVSIVVESAVTRELQAGTLASVSIMGINLYKEYKIIYRNDKHLNAGTQKFLAILRSIYHEENK